MSFAVIHMQKIKSGGIRGIQNHNERLKESKTNPDINYEKSYLNKSLYENNNKTYYNRVRDRIKELDLKRAVRKDAVTLCGFVCTSDTEYLEQLSEHEREKFFKESYEFLKNRYGEKNIVAANIHYDEKTPHLHCYIVPVTKDGRLSAKDIFTRLELRQLQTDYTHYMNGEGFDLVRGISANGKRKHLDTQEFKLETKKQEIKKIRTEFDKTYNALKRDFKTVRSIKSDVNDIERIETKKSLLGGYMKLKTNDYEKLTAMAKQGVYNAAQNIKLQTKVRELEKKLDSALHERSIQDELKDIRLKEYDKLLTKNDNLSSELKKANKEGQSMYDILKKHNLIAEAQRHHESMLNAEKAAEKVLRKSHSQGPER